jgi:ribosomal protein L15E
MVWAYKYKGVIYIDKTHHRIGNGAEIVWTCRNNGVA